MRARAGHLAVYERAPFCQFKTKRQIDRQTDRQTDRQIGRQIDMIPFLMSVTTVYHPLALFLVEKLRCDSSTAAPNASSGQFPKL